MCFPTVNKGLGMPQIIVIVLFYASTTLVLIVFRVQILWEPHIYQYFRNGWNSSRSVMVRNMPQNDSCVEHTFTNIYIYLCINFIYSLWTCWFKRKLNGANCLSQTRLTKGAKLLLCKAVGSWRLGVELQISADFAPSCLTPQKLAISFRWSMSS